MDPDIQRERDELLFSLVKGDRTLHLGLAIVYGACAVTAIVFAFAIVAMNKGIGALLYDIGMIVGFGGMAYVWFQRYKADKAALEEIGDDPSGIDSCRTYSAATADVISESRKTKKELRQQWIAYGILSIVLLGFGIFFVILLMSGFRDEMLFVICGTVLLVGGILLSSLTVKAFREWIVARRLEVLEQRAELAKQENHEKGAR